MDATHSIQSGNPIRLHSASTSSVMTDTSGDITTSSSFIDKLITGCSRTSPNRTCIVLYNLVMPFIVIATTATVGYLSQLPFIFPSLGPTAFLHFAVPDKPAASPKNTLIGHFIGILAGSLALQITGLYDHPNVLTEGVLFARIWCAAISVAITCSCMVWFKVPHPPAGATTLIVSLGLISTPIKLLCMMAAVTLITVEAFIINRICRKDVIYPIWSVKNGANTKKSDDKDDDNKYTKINSHQTMDIAVEDTNNGHGHGGKNEFLLLENRMENLCIDNFVESFKICDKLQDDGNMKKLIQFAKEEENLHLLQQVQGFQTCIPYSLRVALSAQNL